VIRSKTPSEPHHLDVPPGLMLEPAARLNPIEIAVDVELQQYRRVIRWPAGHLRIDPFKSKRAKIELVDKDVDDPNRIVLMNPVLQALRKQRALLSVRPLNEALHTILHRITQESYDANHLRRSVFTQPGSI